MQTRTAPIINTEYPHQYLGWTIEMAFPITNVTSAPFGDGGGLMDVGPATYRVPPNNPDPSSSDNDNRPVYWAIDFARAEHPAFHFNPEYITQNPDGTWNMDKYNELCAGVKQNYSSLIGADKWSCYWEWVWQGLGGLAQKLPPMNMAAYMHNPPYWGYFEFAECVLTCLRTGGKEVGFKTLATKS